ncbi:MAG TPA: hypothetical protein VII12_10385, partial [Thermoanaerobaculia bacterium]
AAHQQLLHQLANGRIVFHDQGAMPRAHERFVTAPKTSEAALTFPPCYRLNLQDETARCDPDTPVADELPLL